MCERARRVEVSRKKCGHERAVVATLCSILLFTRKHVRLVDFVYTYYFIWNLHTFCVVRFSSYSVQIVDTFLTNKGIICQLFYKQMILSFSVILDDGI